MADRKNQRIRNWRNHCCARKQCRGNPEQNQEIESRLPEPPGSEQICSPPMIISHQEDSDESTSENEEKFSESNWLKRMNQE